MRTGDQVKNFTQLITDVKELKGKVVPPELIDQLKKDVTTMLAGANPPDPDTVNTFITDLKEAVADGTIQTWEKVQLTKDFNAVLESANIESAEFLAVVSDIKLILESAEVPPESKQKILDDLNAIAEEFKEQHQRAFPAGR